MVCLTVYFTVRASSIHLMHCGPVLELLIELVAICLGHKRACLKCVPQKEHAAVHRTGVTKCANERTDAHATVINA